MRRPALTRIGGQKGLLSRDFGSCRLSVVRVSCRGRVSRVVCHGHGRRRVRRVRRGGLDLRGQNSARRRLDPDTQGAPSRGEPPGSPTNNRGPRSRAGRAERQCQRTIPPPSPAPLSPGALGWTHGGHEHPFDGAHEPGLGRCSRTCLARCVTCTGSLSRSCNSLCRRGVRTKLSTVKRCPSVSTSRSDVTVNVEP